MKSLRGYRPKSTITCPDCGSQDSHVIDSRADPAGNIRRRRMCHNNHRFTTFEISVVEYRRLAELETQLAAFGRLLRATQL